MDIPENPGGTTADILAEKLAAHERRSQERYEALCEKLDKPKESDMGMDNISDKVNINVGEGRGGDSGASIAAIIAALGNRNQGGDNAGLIAALGNRNNDGGMAALAPMLAGMNGNNGMNNMLPLLLLALLGRGRGGLFGGDDGGGGAVAAGLSPAHAALLQTISENLNGLTAAVPTVGLETQNAIQNAIAQLALGTQQGLSGVKDSVQLAGAASIAATSGVKDAVQNGFALNARDLALINQNILEQGCKGREATQAGTTAVLEKISENRIRELEHRADRAERQVEVNALRSQVEVNQTVTTTQAQAQSQNQFQVQFQDMNNRLSRLFDRVEIVHQEARATNSNVIAGNTGAVTTGAQTSTPTNVNA